jgi:hypothetical protein
VGDQAPMKLINSSGPAPYLVHSWSGKASAMEGDLEQAERRVRMATDAVAAQRRQVEAAKFMGRDTHDAMAILDRLEGVLALFQADLEEFQRLSPFGSKTSQ